MLRRSGYCILMVFCFSACKMSSKYEKPLTETPSAWKNEECQPSTSTAKINHWWEVFASPTLNSLEQELLKKNYDLYIALQKVCEARGAAGVAQSDLYPKLNLNAGYSFFQEFIKYRQTSKEAVLPLKDKLTVNGQDYAFPNLFSYELDIFGKYKTNSKGALLNADSKEEEMRSILLTLTTDLASYYFNIQALDILRSILESESVILKSKLELEELKFQKGLSNLITVSEIETQLYLIQSGVDQNLKQRKLFENSIATLIGKPACTFLLKEELNLPDEVPCISSVIPSKVIMQRPDVASAEKFMESKYYLSRSAYLSFFPDFNITTALGYASYQLKNFLNLKAFLWQAGANLAQTIFDGKKKASEYNASLARFKQAEGNYKLVILKAFQEVESALASSYQEKLRSEKIYNAYLSSSRKDLLTYQRYEKGLSSKLEKYNSELAVLAIQQTYVSVKLTRYQATLDLIKALGGSWN